MKGERGRQVRCGSMTCKDHLSPIGVLDESVVEGNSVGRVEGGLRVSIGGGVGGGGWGTIPPSTLAKIMSCKLRCSTRQKSDKGVDPPV